MEYYIEQDEKIVLHDTDRERLVNTLAFTPQYAGLPVLETEKEIILFNNEFVFKEDKQVELAEIKRQELVGKLYDIKAAKAYGGVIINDAILFETNQVSVTNTVASLALMPDEGSANWKFYNLEGVPVFHEVTKAQLYGIAQFGRAMIDQCFVVEATCNAQLASATVSNLNNDEWVAGFLSSAQNSMDQVNNHLTVALS